MDTTIFSNLNWLAVAIGAVAYFILGALWYGMIFRNAWIKHSGVDMNSDKAKKGGAGLMVVTLILEFITVLALAVIASRINATGGIISGVKLGLVTGTAFAAIAIWISYMYQMRTMTLKMIDAGYHIVGHIIAAAIIFAF